MRISAAGTPDNVLVDTDGALDGLFRFGFHRMRGDFSGDGNMGLDDRTVLLGAYRSGVGDSRYDPAFDLDGDGIISARDYLVVRNLLRNSLSQPDGTKRRDRGTRSRP